MTRILMIATFLGMLLATTSVPGLAITEGTAAQASNYCGGVSDSLGASE